MQIKGSECGKPWTTRDRLQNFVLQQTVVVLLTRTVCCNTVLWPVVCVVHWLTVFETVFVRVALFAVMP